MGSHTLVMETREYADGETNIIAEIRDNGTVGFGIVNVAGGTVIGSAKGCLGVEVLEQLAKRAREVATLEAAAELAKMDGAK
jgi:hypothetical protein